MSGSASTSCVLPFTLSVNLAIGAVSLGLQWLGLDYTRCHARGSGHPILTEHRRVTGSPAFAGDDSGELRKGLYYSPVTNPNAMHAPSRFRTCSSLTPRVMKTSRLE